VDVNDGEARTGTMTIAGQTFTVHQAGATTALRGDIDGDGALTLTDAILALQALSGMTPAGIRAGYATSGADVNGDNRLGVAEVVYVLQSLAGMRNAGACGALAGPWSGTWAGTGCQNEAQSGTWTMTVGADCSVQSFVVNHPCGSGTCQSSGSGTISGDAVTLSLTCIVCGTQSTPGTSILSGTISGTGASGTYSGCGTNGTWTGGRM